VLAGSRGYAHWTGFSDARGEDWTREGTFGLNGGGPELSSRRSAAQLPHGLITASRMVRRAGRPRNANETSRTMRRWVVRLDSRP